MVFGAQFLVYCVTNSSADVKLLLPVASKEIPQTKDRPVQRARKRHWTEAEDAELEKGFRRHGYNWNAMVKDADLHFDGRSGGQIRDRFRLKFKNLYEGQDATHSANKATTDSGPQQREQFGQMPALPKESSNSTTQGEENENGEGNQGKTASKPSFSCSLLGGEDEDSRLSNSILHSDLDWDDNLTLAPLTWEDMATRPIFAFD